MKIPNQPGCSCVSFV